MPIFLQKGKGHESGPVFLPTLLKGKSHED